MAAFSQLTTPWCYDSHHKYNMLHEDLAVIHVYRFHHSAFLAVAHTLIESFVASRSAAGAATVAVECAQATEASKLALWKAIMVGLQPILLDRLQWKLRVKVRGSCPLCLCPRKT